MKIFKKIKSITTYLFLDANETKYIKFNIQKWNSYKIKSAKNTILVDLFNHNPWIHFYSYIHNFLAKKFNAKINFFYFDLYQRRMDKFEISIRKLKKIYKSFNVNEGISEYNFKYTKKELTRYNQKFKKLNFSKYKLSKYKYKNILIGDLIYDTYLRINYYPTIDIKSQKLKKIFFRAHKIFDEITKYLNENNVCCVVPSHVCYINYGIVTRLAIKRNIPVIKIFSKNRGNSSFRLLKIHNKYITEEPPYFDYRKTFNKMNIKEKNKALLLGKKLIQNRISGFYDPNLPYMNKSSFNNKIIKIKSDSKKKKIIIFPHCYFDNPHRYRKMIFEDFFLQVKFFLDIAKTRTEIDWFYKPHPNEITSDINIHKDILKDYENVTCLDKDTSHKNIIKMKPACVITNHGTVAHEYAFFKIPVINTGDNPHINYEFCKHLKSKKEILKCLDNLKSLKKTINFSKKYLYEFMYMHYEFFPNKNMEKIYLKDDYFSFKKNKKNTSSEIFLKFIKQSNVTDNKIKTYVEKFINNNL